MTTKYCTSCECEIGMDLDVCPICGAKQKANYVYQTAEASAAYERAQHMSTHKATAIVALCLPLVGILIGGMILDVISIILSVILLYGKDVEDESAKKLAKIAIVLSVILFIVLLIGLASL